MVNTVKREILADGQLLDGRPFELVELGYDRDVPGSGDTSYAVDIRAAGSLGPLSVGFVSEREARRYLTRYGDMTFHTHNNQGDPGEITRFGHGLPNALIRNRRETTQNDQTAPVIPIPERDADSIERAGNTPSGTTASVDANTQS